MLEQFVVVLARWRTISHGFDPKHPLEGFESPLYFLDILSEVCWVGTLVKVAVVTNLMTILDDCLTHLGMCLDHHPGMKNVDFNSIDRKYSRILGTPTRGS
jgi:hypothetical protein